MKSYLTVFAVLLAVGLIFPNLPSAAQIEPDYKQFTDIVYEWTPGGDMIQVGDFTISRIRSVWLYQGQKDAFGKKILVRASTSHIKIGALATPMMLEQDKNGYWIAEKLILYSGDGLEDVIKTLPDDIKQTLLSK